MAVESHVGCPPKYLACKVPFAVQVCTKTCSNVIDVFGLTHSNESLNALTMTPLQKKGSSYSSTSDDIRVLCT